MEKVHSIFILKFFFSSFENSQFFHWSLISLKTIWAYILHRYVPGVGNNFFMLYVEGFWEVTVHDKIVDFLSHH